MQAKHVILTASEVAASVRPQDFVAPVRLQTSITATPERKFLQWMCQVSPNWLSPDQLTALGFLGAAISALGYAASNRSPAFLFLASFGFVLNWFGDSLDGALARYRRIERPRYGYFVDHAIDSLNGLVFALGLGMCPYVSLTAALFLVCGFYLLCIHVFLAAAIDRRFQLTYFYMGPTELRLLVVLFNGVAYELGPVEVAALGVTASAYSVAVAAMGVIFVVIFLFNLYATARNFRRQDMKSAGGLNASRW